MGVGVDEARAELARRELARREFGEFAGYVYRGWPGARHLEVLCEALGQVERFVATGGAEGIGRLMVFMPPRHWKSTTASVLFPPWFLGRHPDRRVIMASYNASLAFGFSRRARNLMADQRYRAVFGDKAGIPQVVQLAEDSRSVEDWNLAGHHGGMAASGVGGGITGKGAHLFIIDDPHKDRKEAESKAIRDGIWEWYTSTAYTRLEEGAAMVLIQTRWHHDDLAGRLLKRMVEDLGADWWEVLCLRAMAESRNGGEAEGAEGNGLEIPRLPLVARNDGFGMVARNDGIGVRNDGDDVLGREAGEALWPEQYPIGALERIRANIGAYEWEALYQQRPQRIEGALIKAYDIILINEEELPEDLTEVRYWDLAVSGREGADWIVGGRVGRGKDGRIYIRHIARMPGPWADARPQMVEVMLADPMHVVQGIEVAGQQAGYFQELQRDRALATRSVVGVNPKEVGNKEVRANVWSSRIQDGLVYMVRGLWNDAFLAEAIQFPRGTFDDQVDGVSGAVQMLAQEEYGPPGVVAYA